MLVLLAGKHWKRNRKVPSCSYLHSCLPKSQGSWRKIPTARGQFINLKFIFVPTHVLNSITFSIRFLIGLKTFVCMRILLLMAQLLTNSGNKGYHFIVILIIWSFSLLMKINEDNTALYVQLHHVFLVYLKYSKSHLKKLFHFLINSCIAFNNFYKIIL